MTNERKLHVFIVIHPDTGQEYRYERHILQPETRLDLLCARDGISQAFTKLFKVPPQDIREIPA